MNEYVGKMCPYCKTPFKEDDEIVVCNTCDMPHHKDCWVDNQGCTTFGCLGTIKAPDGTPTTVTSSEITFDEPQSQTVTTVYCTKCGSPNQSSSSFCCKCGNPLQTNTPTHSVTGYASDNSNTVNPYAYVSQENYQPQSGYSTQQNNTTGYNSQYSTGYSAISSDADLNAFVGTKAEYYIPKFNEMKAQNKKTSWNWCAFLVAPYWFIYRKMYGYGAAALGAAFILSVIGGIFTSLLALAGYIVLGIYGNYIYMQQVDKNVAQLKTLTEPYKTQLISRNGGTNSTATILTVVGYAILILIIQAL